MLSDFSPLNVAQLEITFGEKLNFQPLLRMSIFFTEIVECIQFIYMKVCLLIKVKLPCKCLVKPRASINIMIALVPYVKKISLLQNINKVMN